MIAEVIVSQKTSREFFSYSIPEVFSEKISVGSVVEVEFGNKKILGVVSKIKKENEVGEKLKEILTVKNGYLIDSIYTEIARWISKYYFCTFSEAISLFLPPNIKKPRKQKSENCKKTIIGRINLNNEQRTIYNQILKDLSLKSKKPGLIFGVTGSGKTELYLALAKKTLQLGRSVIILVPEIVLTPQNISRFKKIFANEVTIMHSKLSKSERYFCYRKFYNEEKRIIIGPRSALLIPNKNVGLIVIDEEQEDSYKQEHNPRYEAVNLAEKIAKFTGANLILGSATPKIETFYKAEKGFFNLYRLTKRFHHPNLPEAKIIDMKQEIKKGNNSMLSETLQREIKKVLDKSGQVILFLNRKGMATFISCRDCGEIIFCNRCDVPMVYHINSAVDYLRCHHCDKKQSVPQKCPRCGSYKIKFFGSGTEKLEKEVKRLFPEAKIKRIDSDEFKNIFDYENFYKDFSQHKYDIVIGTQILAKGFDIPGVDLVGIVSADVGLHLPYFRASEKVFRLITQVSGRSGRRKTSGKTIIQTYWPESEAIKYASKHDYEGFYREEIKRRLKKNYPPKKQIVKVLSENQDQLKAKRNIKLLADDLRKNNFDFIGPGECFFSKISNRFRFQLLIKVDCLPNELLLEIYKKHKNLIWDADPVNFL